MQQTLTSRLNTNGLTGGHNFTHNWEAHRPELDHILGTGAESLESKIDSMVGNLEDYEETKILKTNNPKERIEELAAKVEQAFTTLNQFYQQLRNGNLKYKVVYHGIVNFWRKKHSDSIDREKREITSFQLARDNTKYENGSFQILPTDENGNTFTTHYANNGIDTKYFGNGDNIPLYNQIQGYEVTPKGKGNYHQLSFSIFAQALVQLRNLRNKLETLKLRMEIEEQAAQVASSVSQELDQ